MTKNYCKRFQDAHPNVRFEKDDNDVILISNCWRDSSCVFKFKNNESHNLRFLNNIIMRDELLAIYHIKEQMYEFIFTPLANKFQRDFKYIFEGKEFHLYYSTPTKAFEKLSLHFDLNDSDGISDRAFAFMRYSQYYTEKKENPILYPTNFFVKGNFRNIQFDEHIELFKHINFLMSYYDRKSPTIHICSISDADPSKINTPCKMQKGEFPLILNSRRFDPTLLDLMETARTTHSIRLKYIFYYQVIEYCSYYYIENELKRRVENVIRTPDILNTNAYSQIIIELFSDYLKNKPDAQRMGKLINDFCAFQEIEDEIICNADYFIKDLQFEGGLIIKKLFDKKEDIKSAHSGIMDTIRKNIDNIRNVLVHARESRENTVISPTPQNNVLLMPYLYLLRRIAEIIVVKYV